MRVRLILAIGVLMLAAAVAGLLFLDLDPVPELAFPKPPVVQEPELPSGTLNPVRSGTAVPTTGPMPVLLETCARLLAIDGGGIRGLAPALILAEIERLTGKPIASQFDIIAGTSTGAIIALGLARPSDDDASRPAFTAINLAELYQRHGSKVFPNSSSWYAKARQFVRPKYTSQGATAVLNDHFGDVRLVEALTTVLVPVYDIRENSRIWFSSSDDWSRDTLMSDLARGATAAPSYLPPARFVVPGTNPSQHRIVTAVDGALFANNPAIEALADSDKRTFRQPDEYNRSVLMVSIGTGKLGAGHAFEDVWRWGLLGWLTPLLEIAFNDPGIERAASGLMESRGHYHRLQVESDVALDDATPDGIRRLEAATRKLIEVEAGRLKTIAQQLALPRPERGCGGMLGANYVPSEGPRKQPASRQ